MPNDSPVNDDHIFRIQEYIDHMPSLSTTVTKVIEVCNQPTTSPNDLNRVISLDPVLTGQVLKLINSAYYSLPNQVTSLTRAIIMLGLNTVKNLALSTAILGTMGKEKSTCLSMDEFWNHSLCVGVTAKVLAAMKKFPAAVHEEFFVAGLLHDLGKIPLTNCFADDYKKALELAWMQGCSLARAETMIFGFDHCFAGSLIAEKWQLTGSIADVIRGHHFSRMPKTNQEAVTGVAFANLYANLYEIGSAGNMHQEAVDVSIVIDGAGVSWNTLSAQRKMIDEEIEKAQIFLQVAGGGK